ncbi:glycosyltransferase family A protein [Shimia sp.]|uniref:glycosyltransferase family A protein n=1 Tax=Shimia sp. TaxID=1954381 RepID=UPI00329A44C4
MAQHYIISLSSIPPRFHQLESTLQSLLAQTVPARNIILYLNRSYRRFPDWDGQPPNVPDGVEIRWVEEDYGPATKVLPAVKEFSGQDIDILFCDDDQEYRPNLAERLLAARLRRPNDALAVSGMQDYDALPGTKRQFDRNPRRLYLWKATNVAYRIGTVWNDLASKMFGRPRKELARRLILRPGYADGFEGWMGVMVRPEFFPPEVFDIPEFAWPVDDVWLSGHLMRQGHGAWIVGGFFEPILQPIMKAAHGDNQALFKSEFDGKDRHVLNAEAARYFQDTYGIWL